LPPKPEAKCSKPHQQHIPLDLKTTPEGLRRAEAEAKKVGAALDLKEFNWANYPLRAATKTAPQTVADWLAAFEGHYFADRKRTLKIESSFKAAYYDYLKRLPQAQLLTAAVLERGIKATEPDSCTRKAICFAYKSFGAFAGIDVSFINKKVRGNYSSLKPAPRVLPTDETIVEVFFQIPNLNWRWVFGMMAVFGLRPHEVFHLDTQELEQGGRVLKVLDDTKTGYREVLPLHSEWIDQFDLRHKRLPNIQVVGKNNQALGAKISCGFRRYKVPFPPYNLRHSYAVRCVAFGFHESMAARWMGHSVAIHTGTYHQWISGPTEQAVFERSMQNPNRPKPPVVKLVAA
jgi:integrase